MDKPRIFLGSSAQQEKLLQALTRGLSDVAHVEPWMTSFNPGTSALERLLELTQAVGFVPGWVGSGIAARQRCVRSRSFRRHPRNAPNLYSPCKRGEASDRPPGPHMRTVRRRADAVRVETHQPENPESDRRRRSCCSHRGLMVAVLPDGARSAGAFRREHHPDLKRP